MTAVVAAASALYSTHVQAYCFTRSCDPDDDAAGGCALDAQTRCSIAGVELRRKNGCVAFGVEEGAGARLGLTDDVFASVVQRAFERWAMVSCGDGSPGLEIGYVGALDVEDRFSCRLEGTDVDTWLLSSNLGSTSVSATSGVTAGKTFHAFTADSGQIFDSDVELNEQWLATLTQAELVPLLLTVATHEAGHALGLAHSQDQNSLMFREYAVTPDRPLTLDDVQGICELFPPGEALSCGELSYSPAGLNQAACDAAQEDDEELREYLKPVSCGVVGYSGHTGQAGLLLFALGGVALSLWWRRASV